MHERGVQLVGAPARRRNQWRGSCGATDVHDPYRRSAAVHDEVGHAIAGALLPLLQVAVGSRTSAA